MSGGRFFRSGALCGVALAVVAATSLGAPSEQTVLPVGLPDLPMHVRRDALTSFFLFLLGATSAGISVFAAGYFRRGEGTAPGLMCLQYHLFLASMGFVLLADDAYAFMVAWETMALSSYFLVTTQHGLPEIRRAGFLYLLIAHVGAIAILLSFGVMQGGSWQFTFDAMRGAHLTPYWAAVAFLLALFGFGAKAGLVPLHVWLPEAHPAAPSPVSALMSGVDAEDGRLRRAARDLRSAGQARMVVGPRAARRRTFQCALRRGICRGPDGYEAAARVVIDREPRHHLCGHRACHRVPRRGHEFPRRARADRRPVSQPQSRVHEESAVSRYGSGSALHR